MWAQDAYFKYFPSEKMAHMKATVRKRAMMGIKTLPQLLQHKTRENWEEEGAGKTK